MSVRKGGLGRGLDSLLGAAKVPKVPVDPSGSTSVSTGGSTAQGQAPSSLPPVTSLKTLPVDLLQRGQYQPRREINQDALEELSSSIRAQGVIQPIVVRSIGEGRYEIIAGERRWRAAQLAGLQEIPVVIKQISDQAAMAMALIENIQREDLNPIEEAVALQRLIKEFGLTQQKAADAVGRSRTSVTNMLRLLNLNAEVGQLLEKGKLEMGHARALLALEGEQQSEAAKQVILLGLSVREAEKLVRKMLNPPKRRVVEEVDPNVRHLQTRLSETLGASVTIHQSGKGRGKLTIQYNSLDELDGILEHIK
ncbi:MAG: ParB/RepB/Spo0J family partition protein [Gammaproteobacteria bacterium]|uniref:Probable chromosome-partitioning protein ParB n=1 Tax=Candidatus Thiopontia autotrophica TaxID=2841688 RepID=A0A8J6TQ42_9GAMM|nr:ParB/RepB/Spo0J family partition protein [Candidatus Thiopontia autotrophica]MBL6969048.1 ParB/RepB/Spo0J family partition protein [Gammaproteobacteria bacterium]